MNPEFVAPGKGPWELETTHFSRPVSRFAGETYADGFVKGFSSGTARYGLLLDHLKPAISHDFIYMQPAPFMAPEGAMKPPPAPVLWLLTRLHPKMRARIAQSDRAFAEKQWRKDLETWDTVDKPAAIEKHLALQMIDVTALSDDALVDHLAECRDHAIAMVGQHHKYTATAIVPIGDFLAHTVAWTGAHPGEVCRLLQGSSPISNGFAAEELGKVGEALAANPQAAERLRSGPPAEAIATLSEDPDVGSAVRAYVEAVQHRSVGYDVGDVNAGEMPELLAGAMLAAAAGPTASTLDDAAVAALRAKVPAEHQAQFDELLAEARFTNRIRDERGVFSDGWATGIARRAVLEVGRRLAERGLLRTPEHAPDLTYDELVSLLRDGTGPSADEAAAHHEWRTTKTVADAPPFLNAMPPEPPPVDLLPAKARRAANATNIMLMTLFATSEEANSETVLHGLSVNDGTYEGTARLVTGSAEFGKIQQGDVLVTRNTSPYFNVVLPLLGAIVTDRGGQLSHAAIVAREYGIPGVVGTRDATTTIPDGARVRVDGATGEVHLLGTS